MSYEDNEEMEDSLEDAEETLFTASEDVAEDVQQPAKNESNTGCKVRRKIEDILEMKRYREEQGDEYSLDYAFE